MNVSDISTEVLKRLGPGPNTTAADLYQAIDEGNKVLYGRILRVSEKLLYGTSSFNAVNGTQEYTTTEGVASDIKKILKVETRYSGQDIRYPATKIDLPNVAKMDYTSTTYQNIYQPRYYWFGMGSNVTIGFVPKHDVNGADYNKIWYLKMATDLTDGDDVPVCPEDSHYLITQYALAVAQLIEDEDRISYNSLLDRFEANVEMYLEEISPGIGEPQFSQDVDGDFMPI